METPKNFRSAFNGFNREDVVRYIEYVNTCHTTQVNELTTELEFLRAKLNAVDSVPAIDSEMIDRLNAALLEVKKLEERCAELEQERDAALANGNTAELEERCAQLEQERDAALANSNTAELEARCAQLEQERDAALAAAEEAKNAQAVITQNCAAQELEAYRRAERAERVANERADKVYAKVNGVLSDATVKVDEAATQIGEVSDQVITRLSQLLNAISGSKQALEEAVAIMYAIRPSEEE